VQVLFKKVQDNLNSHKSQHRETLNASLKVQMPQKRIQNTTANSPLLAMEADNPSIITKNDV
jgi:hypothetical protein